jgi:hypothetical protein
MDFSCVSYVGFRTAGVAQRYENDPRRICKVKHERMDAPHRKGGHAIKVD